MRLQHAGCGPLAVVVSSVTEEMRPVNRSAACAPTAHVRPAGANACNGLVPVQREDSEPRRTNPQVCGLADAVRALLDACAVHDHTWVKRHRALNTLGLFAILAAKRGRKDPVWKGQEYLHLLSGGLVPAANVNPASVSKALKRMPVGTLQNVHEHLTTNLLQQPGAILHPPPHLRRIYAVDSTKLDVPQKMAAIGYRPIRRDGVVPKLMLSTIIDVRTGILVACDATNSLHEREALRRLVERNAIPPGTILLADRGYYSRSVWSMLKRHDIHPLFRCKSDADTTLRTAFNNRRKTQHITIDGAPAVVHRWATARDGKRKKKWPHRQMQPTDPPLHARHLRPNIPQDDVPKAEELVLVSTLNFTRYEATETYQLRWQVESAYDIVKNTLGMGKNEGAPHTIAHTHQALVLLHAFLRILDIKNDANRVYNKHGTLGKVWTQSSTRHHQTACVILAHALTHSHQPPPQARIIERIVYVPQLPPPPPTPPPNAPGRRPSDSTRCTRRRTL